MCVIAGTLSLETSRRVYTVPLKLKKDIIIVSNDGNVVGTLQPTVTGLTAWYHRWVNRQHGEVTFYLSQILLGNRCFRAYLCRFKTWSFSGLPGLQRSLSGAGIFYVPPFQCAPWRTGSHPRTRYYNVESGGGDAVLTSSVGGVE